MTGQPTKGRARAVPDANAPIADRLGADGGYLILDPYNNPNPATPRIEGPDPVVFLTQQDGVKVIYSAETAPTCGVRILHPSNPRTPGTKLGLSVLYVPPGSRMELHDHEAEEVYVIQSGTGEMLTDDGTREVGPGDFVYLPPWAKHGIVNTGREMLSVLLALTPPNP
jgi:mannose-6-phosphate isomerase-like protein (cupin superfamily)